MSTYGFTLIDKPLPEIEHALCSSFGITALQSATEATVDDLLVLESRDGRTVLDNQGSLRFTAAIPEYAEQLVALSAATNSQIRAVTVQTGVGYVHLFVVESGRVLRRLEICESRVSANEGILPEWESLISSDPERAANELFGFVESPVQPGLLSRLWERTSDPQITIRAPVGGSVPYLLLEVAPPSKSISFTSLAKTAAEILAVTVDNGDLSIRFQDGQTRILRRADVEKVVPNPFTGLPVLLLNDDTSVQLPSSTPEDAWRVLQEWAGRSFERLAQSSARQPLLKEQLVPLAGILVGATIGGIKSWASGESLWDLQGTINSIGLFGAAGFFAGVIAYYSYNWVTKREMKTQHAEQRVR